MKNFKFDVRFVFAVLFTISCVGFLPIAVKARPVAPPDTLKFEPTEAHVEDVITHMLTALGANALAGVKDRSLNGKFITKIQGKEAVGSLLTIEEAPGKRSDQLYLLDKSIRHLIDGRHSWISDSTGNLRALKGASLQSDLAQAVFNPELHLRDSGVSVLLVGTTNLDSLGKTYVLKVQFKGAYPELWYVSAANYNIVQRGQPVNGMVLWTRYSDFRVVDGVTYPFRVDASGPENFRIEYDTIRHNIRPAESTFEGK